MLILGTDSALGVTGTRCQEQHQLVAKQKLNGSGVRGETPLALKGALELDGPSELSESGTGGWDSVLPIYQAFLHASCRCKRCSL